MLPRILVGPDQQVKVLTRPSALVHRNSTGILTSSLKPKTSISVAGPSVSASKRVVKAG
jgi:hypothetical protein